MKKFFLIAVLLNMLFDGYAQTTLKVMSFNIHAGADASLEQLASFIKKQNPDVVALQEVDYYTTRSKGVDMLLELSYLTGMHGMFFPAIDAHGGKYGNAILSKYSFDETQKKILHLDMANLSNGLLQVGELTKIPQTGELCVLAGDLNRRVGTEHINLLSTVWDLAVSNTFDHVAYYPQNRWVVKETKIFEEVLSDHKAIMAVLEIK